MARQYDPKEAVLAQGLLQTSLYVDRTGAEEAHLVIFDRYDKKSWDEKIYRREQVYEGRVITVWGM